MPGVTTTEPDVPDVARPLPLQEVAFVELHERVDDLPGLTDVGLAESEAIGAGGGDAVTVTVTVAAVDPPVPEQVIE